MIKHETHNFSYKAVSGKVTEREAFVISTPSDSYYTLELSEFDEIEKEYYTAALKEFYEKHQEEEFEFLQELGLKNNFRRMKADGIS